MNTAMTYGHTVKGIIEGDSDPDTFLPFDRMIKTWPFAQINEAIAAQHRGACVKVVLLMGA